MLRNIYTELYMEHTETVCLSGLHELKWNNAIFVSKIKFTSWFNGGMSCHDIAHLCSRSKREMRRNEFRANDVLVFFEKFLFHLYIKEFKFVLENNVYYRGLGCRLGSTSNSIFWMRITMKSLSWLHFLCHFRELKRKLFRLINVRLLLDSVIISETIIDAIVMSLA